MVLSINVISDPKLYVAKLPPLESYFLPYHIPVRGCAIITSRIEGGLVSAFFVMLRDGKPGGEWYFMKGHNVTVKKIINPFFVLLRRDRDFINIEH